MSTATSVPQPHAQQTQPQTSQSQRQREAAEAIDLLHEASNLMDTGLSRQEISLCVSLVESGVQPEALVAVIKDLRAQKRDGYQRQREEESEVEGE